MEKKRIFAYVGSPRGKQSNTYQLTQRVLAGVVENAVSSVQYEIITPKDRPLQHCTGCQRCFIEGKCTLDGVDGLDIIKKKLMEADMILLGSPVYACNVTSEMKGLIDRLSYWLHLLLLAGKPSVSLVTASSNSIVETSAYLKKILQIWGTELICSIQCTVDFPKMLEDPTFIEESIPAKVQLLVDYIDGHQQTKSTEFHEKYFQFLKSIYSAPSDIEYSEQKHWRTSGYLNYENYEQLLASKR